MSQQSAVVARLALRELWISFRLLILLVAFVAAGVVVALLPAPFPTVVQRLVIGITAASALSGALAAWSLAVERRTGRAGWLVARSVPRGTLLGGWFTGIGGTALVGLAMAATLGWLALPAGTPIDPARFGLAVVVLAAAAVAWIALGLLAGAMAPRALATLVVIVTGATLLGVRLAGIGANVEVWLMSAGSVGHLLRLLGGLLVLAGLLLGAARVAMERAEL